MMMTIRIGVMTMGDFGSWEELWHERVVGLAFIVMGGLYFFMVRSSSISSSSSSSSSNLGRDDGIMDGGEKGLFL